jgi:hypothetical protein
MADQPRLVRSHRTLGYELGRISDPANPGRELSTLRTGPNPQDMTVSPAHMLAPVQPQELAFDIRMQLHAVIERARFLGVPDDALRSLLDEELRAAS